MRSHSISSLNLKRGTARVKRATVRRADKRDVATWCAIIDRGRMGDEDAVQGSIEKYDGITGFVSGTWKRHASHRKAISTAWKSCPGHTEARHATIWRFSKSAYFPFERSEQWPQKILGPFHVPDLQLPQSYGVLLCFPGHLLANKVNLEFIKEKNGLSTISTQQTWRLCVQLSPPALYSHQFIIKLRSATL